MYGGKQFNDRLKQVLFIIVLVFLFYIIVTNLSYFASSFLGGFTLYMLLRKPHLYLTAKWKNTTLATSFLMLASFLVLLSVGGGIFYLFYGKLRHFHPQGIMNGVYHIQEIIQQKFGYDIFSEEVIDKAINAIGNILPGIISTTGNVFANLVMMMFVLFFMLQSNQQFVRTMEKAIPLSQDSVHLLKKEANGMIIGNAVGIPLIMLCQGIVAAFGYWIFDAGDPLLWGVLTGVFGLLPIVGTGGVWAPLAINLLIGGNIWQGIALLIYGAVVISYVDNLFRIGFMKKMANVHPLVTLFGIILGMNLFGFWGIIFGPLVISGFILLFKIYRKEFLTA